MYIWSIKLISFKCIKLLALTHLLSKITSNNYFAVPGTVQNVGFSSLMLKGYTMLTLSLHFSLISSGFLSVTVHVHVQETFGINVFDKVQDIKVLRLIQRYQQTDNRQRLKASPS